MSHPFQKFVLSKTLVSLVFLGVPFTAFAIKILDPLNAKSPTEVFARVIQGFLGIVGVFALLNFVLAGVGLITSRGNPEKVQKHKENLIWTIMGIALLFGSYAIINYVLDKLSGVSGVGG